MRRTVDFSASAAGRGSRGSVSDDALTRLRFKLLASEKASEQPSEPQPKSDIIDRPKDLEEESKEPLKKQDEYEEQNEAESPAGENITPRNIFLKAREK